MPDRRFKPKKKPPEARKHVALLVLLAILIAGSFLLFMPPGEKIRQGLDVQGGLSVVLEGAHADGSDPTTEEMAAARQIVERRVNLLGASETSVQVQGAKQLMVQIPGIVDQSQAIEVIGQTGALEFVNLEDVTDEDTLKLLNSGNLLTDKDINEGLAFMQIDPSQITGAEVSPQTHRVPPGSYVQMSMSAGEDSSDTFVLYKYLLLDPGSYAPIFKGSNITNVTTGLKDDISFEYSVNITLDAEATQAFAEVTTKLYPTHGKIAIVLDGAIQQAPAVQSAIKDGNVQITGNYDIKEADTLKTILQSGSLPVTLNVVNASMVGPTLGQEALFAGILVALIGLACVALYLLFFYRGIGLLTAGAIAVFAVLYLGVLALLSAFGMFALSLAGIAGIVLAIGVAADSSILVLERFKEEIRMGRSVRASSITGVRHAIITSIDADLVTLVSALALFFIAVGTVKGFGLTLALGVICDILTMLLLKAPLIRILAPKVIANNPGFWGIKEDEELARAAGELNRGGENG
jgi:SecD/SecF fusion protein